MKKSIFPLVFLVFSFTSCIESKRETKRLLENDDTRNEVFAQITNNYEYMREFSDKMIESGSAVDVFINQPQVVDQMINGDGMIKLLNENPQAKQHMMAMMIKDTLMSSQLVEKAAMQPKGAMQMVKQLESAKILTKECSEEALKYLTKKDAPTNTPTIKKKN